MRGVAALLLCCCLAAAAAKRDEAAESKEAAATETTTASSEPKKAESKPGSEEEEAKSEESKEAAPETKKPKVTTKATTIKAPETKKPPATKKLRGTTKKAAPKSKSSEEEEKEEEAPETKPPTTTPEATIFRPKSETTEPKRWEVNYGKSGDVRTKEEGNWNLGPGAEDSDDPESAASTDSEEKITIVKTHREEGAHSGPHTCFVCNSASDPKCGDTDWDEEYAKKTFSQKCAVNRPEGDEYKDSPIVGCRKVTTDFPDGGYRVVRQCAFSGPPDLPAHKKAGSEGLIRWFYQCPSPDCNAAFAALPSALLLLLLSSLSILLRL